MSDLAMKRRAGGDVVRMAGSRSERERAALRAERDAAVAQTTALRTCLLVLAKRDGRIRVPRAELDAIDEGRDTVMVEVAEDGATIVTYREVAT